MAKIKIIAILLIVTTLFASMPFFAVPSSAALYAIMDNNIANPSDPFSPANHIGGSDSIKYAYMLLGLMLTGTVVAGTLYAIDATGYNSSMTSSVTIYPIDTLNPNSQIVDASQSLYSTLSKVRPLAENIVNEITKITQERIYYFAYIDTNGLNINKTVSLNYIEAYYILQSCGYINIAIDTINATLQTLVSYISPSADIFKLVNDIKLLQAKNKAGKDYVGIYTIAEKDAAKLAYASGAFHNGLTQSEIHNTTVDSGYYYHFHDITHKIHVWYGYAF